MEIWRSGVSSHSGLELVREQLRLAHAEPGSWLHEQIDDCLSELDRVAEEEDIPQSTLVLLRAKAFALLETYRVYLIDKASHA